MPSAYCGLSDRPALGNEFWRRLACDAHSAPTVILGGFGCEACIQMAPLASVSDTTGRRTGGPDEWRAAAGEGRRRTQVCAASSSLHTQPRSDSVIHFAHVGPSGASCAGHLSAGRAGARQDSPRLDVAPSHHLQPREPELSRTGLCSRAELCGAASESRTLATLAFVTSSNGVTV